MQNLMSNFFPCGQVTLSYNWFCNLNEQTDNLYMIWVNELLGYEIGHISRLLALSNTFDTQASSTSSRQAFIPRHRVLSPHPVQVPTVLLTLGRWIHKYPYRSPTVLVACLVRNSLTVAA